MKTMPLSSKQQGATLFIGLILLIAISLISLAAMRTSILDLIIANNKQQFTYTFEAAEQVVNERLSNMAITLAGVPVPRTNVGGSAQIEAVSYPNSTGADVTVANIASSVCFRNAGSALGFAIGSGSAYHFQLDSVATSPGRGAASNHRIGFFILGPGAPPATAAPGTDC